MKQFQILLFTLGILALCSCEDDAYYPISIDTSREYAGGSTTIFSSSSIAYGSPASNITGSDYTLHLEGDRGFNLVFVTAPSALNPGLGPVYNNSSCVRCHPSDGRGRFPADINSFNSLLFRTSIPGTNANGGPVAVPGYGTQIQNHAIPGFVPEASYQVVWTETAEALADGSIIQLRKPAFSINNPYQSVPSNMMISARLGPPVFGLGLLEYIPEADILAKADEFDSDGDGISGKPNYVWNPLTQQTELGRFGWKANTSSLQVQVASAFYDDMGVTSWGFPFDSQNDNLNDDPEIPKTLIDKVTFYCRTLAVPAARNVSDINVNNGYQIFQELNCSKCHTPQQKTGYSPVSSLAYQTFFPFTDMLLHDMGDELADNRPDYKANGKEWKTRPLWGIGLQQIVNGHTEYLHDGRARNLTEAILWHGGEAQASRDAFKNLSLQKRNDLLKFLNSL